MIGRQQEGTIIAIVNAPTIDLFAIINAARYQKHPARRRWARRRTADRHSRLGQCIAAFHR